MKHIILTAFYLLFLVLITVSAAGDPSWECKDDPSGDCYHHHQTQESCVDLCKENTGCNFFKWSSLYFGSCHMSYRNKTLLDLGLEYNFWCGKDGSGCIAGECTNGPDTPSYNSTPTPIME